jgi:hypothetical protein
VKRPKNQPTKPLEALFPAERFIPAGFNEASHPPNNNHHSNQQSGKIGQHRGKTMVEKLCNGEGRDIMGGTLGNEVHVSELRM